MMAVFKAKEIRAATVRERFPFPAANRLLTRAALISFALLLCFSEPALAQGCALCKSAVASQVAEAIEAINTGIILLLVPPVGMMSAILFVAFRRRDRNDTD